MHNKQHIWMKIDVFLVPGSTKVPGFIKVMIMITFQYPKSHQIKTLPHRDTGNTQIFCCLKYLTLLSIYKLLSQNPFLGVWGILCSIVKHQIIQAVNQWNTLWSTSVTWQLGLEYCLATWAFKNWLCPGQHGWLLACSLLVLCPSYFLTWGSTFLLIYFINKMDCTVLEEGCVECGWW